MILRALLISLMTWLPLLASSFFSGIALSGPEIPFLYDLGSHVRFLIAVPALVLAEIPVAQRPRGAVAHFEEAGLVRDGDREAFRKLRPDLPFGFWSWTAILILVYVSVYFVNLKSELRAERIWFESGPGDGHFLAGLYYLWIALPVFYFLVYRWCFRLVIWTKYLWQVSRLNLFLSPSHPDRVGGLAFIGKCSVPFGLVLFALSAVVSGAIGSRVLFGGARIEEFVFNYAALILLSIHLLGVPLLGFVPHLIRVKEQGLLRYGDFASRYTHLFEEKWLRERIPPDDLLGSGDIQSLADLGGSFDGVRSMRIIPIELRDVLAIAALGLVPALPLVLLKMPVSDVLKGIVRLLVN